MYKNKQISIAFNYFSQSPRREDPLKKIALPSQLLGESVQLTAYLHFRDDHAAYMSNSFSNVNHVLFNLISLESSVSDLELCRPFIIISFDRPNTLPLLSLRHLQPKCNIRFPTHYWELSIQFPIYSSIYHCEYAWLALWGHFTEFSLRFQVN